MRIAITIPGDPVPKARPFVRKDGRVFTPKKTAIFETAVRMRAMAAMKGHKIITGAVRLTVTAFFSIPVGYHLSKKAKATAGILRHTKRPDGSNVLKSVEDGLNGIVYVDDCQIYDSRVIKNYSDFPRTEIIVEAED